MVDRMKKLKPEQTKLLLEILKTRAGKYYLLLQEEGIDCLSTDQANEVRNILTDELTESGLRDDWEPNKRGLAIEGLIDALAPY